MTITLGADFPAATADQWRRLALAALRKSGNATDETGLDQVDDLLTTITYDGLRLPALNTPDGLTAAFPGQFPYARGARAARGLIGGWDVRQRHDGSGSVLDDLENGATSLWLAVPPSELPAVLEGVYLGLVGVVLDPGDAFVEAADVFFDLAASAPAAPPTPLRPTAVGDGQPRTGPGTTPPRPATAHDGQPRTGPGTTPPRPATARGVQLRGGFGADPLGWRARTGDAGGLSGALRDAASLAGRCVADAPGMRAITVDATIYHEAGGSDAEELGCAVACGVAYLRALTGSGLPVRAAFGQLEFRYAATADQFATTAKLRAARRVWARVAEMCEAADAGGQLQHAVTSAAMMTARDPWVNLLRTTLATFAAGVGGADAVTVLPFDHPLGRPDALARRLARNTQTLLIEEAHAARVLDPAGGSWYVERYTDELAQAAWEWFTTIEQAGGLAAALDSGLVADRLAATWARREADIAHRRAPLTGVSEFPLLDEQLPARTPAPAPDGRSQGPARPNNDNLAQRTPHGPSQSPTHPDNDNLAQHTPHDPSQSPAEPIPPGSDNPAQLPSDDRWPDPGAPQAAGEGPTRLLATASPPRGGLPRRRYAEAFERLRDRGDAHLAATGKRPTVSLVLLGSAASHGPRLAFVTNLFAAGGIAVTTEPGSAVVCLCGPDKAYTEGAAEAARAAGAERVLLAGRGNFAGVDGYVFTGCDAVAVLQTTLADLGVQA